jgi:hypothetical protein
VTLLLVLRSMLVGRLCSAPCGEVVNCLYVSTMASVARVEQLCCWLEFLHVLLAWTAAV